MTTASNAWVEPTRLSTPTMYLPRYLGGITLFVISYLTVFAFEDSSALTVVVAVIFTIAGWLVLPGKLHRRGIAAAVAALSVGIGLGLALGLGFWRFEILLFWIVQFALWLFVRERPGMTYLTLLISVIVAVLSEPFAELLWEIVEPLALNIWIVLAILSIVLPAWIARWLAPNFAASAEARRVKSEESIRRAPEERTGVDQVVGKDGQVYVSLQSQTNQMAIMSLVFAFVFNVLGVVFGHVARKQIRVTGEQGWGLATAGLIIGYVSIGITVLALIAYGVFILFILSR